MTGQGLKINGGSVKEVFLSSGARSALGDFGGS